MALSPGRPAAVTTVRRTALSSRAVKLAALNRLPYDIFDASGKLFVSGQTSELSRELPPGKYRIRIDALGQLPEEPLTIVPDQTTMLSLGVEGDRFMIQH